MSDDTDAPPRKKVRRAMEDGPELKSKPVLIRVGKTKEEYHIHENVLRSNSSFFDNALKKEWIKDQDRAIDLPEAKNEAFGIWIKWLYTGNVFMVRPDDLSNGGKTSEELPRWGICYALGDFLQDADFKDACIDVAIERILQFNSHPSALAKRIYDNSAMKSNHRKLAVDIFVHCWKREDWITYIDQPYQFLQDVIMSIGPKIASCTDLLSYKRFFNLDNTCKYHDHGPDKPCYKNKPAFRS